MCGIAGLIAPFLPPEVRGEAVGRMCNAMVHRGPDDEGISTEGDATLGMRRLAIFDPANGRQPMQSPDGRLTLVFNGAIYNFRDLRRQLAGSWDFRTECDTEVLLAAFARWGEACVPKLRGMFAFAIWDRGARCLFLARDAFGVKPLYFRELPGGGLVFASEIRALNASGAGSSIIDASGVADYLAWMAVPAPRTIYRDIRSLRPGEAARYRGGRLEIAAGWRFSTIAPPERVCRTREEFLVELRSRLEDSVRAHSLADVPVGAFLSGGLDSASVVALMNRSAGGRLKTFTVDFGESGFSEGKPASETARFLGTEHRTLTLSGTDLASGLDSYLSALDQPTGDGVNTFYASRAAREGGVTVALSGLGGDELFGGYPSFRTTPRFTRLLPAWRAVPAGVRRSVVRRLRRGDIRRRKLADVLEHASNSVQTGALQRRVLSTSGLESVLSRGASVLTEGKYALHPAYAELAADLDPGAVYEVVSAWELRTYMADVLLRDSDVMSMRHSLELRVPLVDRPLIEWLWHQPAAFKGDFRDPKSALRDALGDLLPPSLKNRRKWGFSLPMDLWMRRELRPFLEDTFATANVARSGFFNVASVEANWRAYLQSNDSREWSRIWSLAVLIAFLNRRPTPAPSLLPSATTLSAPPTSLEATPGNSGALNSPSPSSPLAPRPSPLTSRSLLLVPEIFSSEGGIQRIMRAYLRALAELTASPGSLRLLSLNDPEIDPRKLHTTERAALSKAEGCRRRKACLLRKTLQLARQTDHIICGHIFMLPAAWMAQRLNPRLRYSLVAHGIEVWRPFSAIERTALRGASRILCVSDFTRGELLRYCPLPDGRAVVLPNTLDPDFPIEAGHPLADCPPTILTVSRLTAGDRYKGVEDLILAMPAVLAETPAARLRIIGRGDDLPRLMQLARQISVADAVDFLGYVDDARLRDELRSCRLFALPSRKEGFGLVFLEAMAHGRPCLGARAGGAPEVISPESGILAEYGDVPDITSAIREGMTRNWSCRNILGRAGAFSFPAFREKLAARLSE